MRQAPHLLTALAVILAAGGVLGVSATRAPAPARPARVIEVAITVDDFTRPPLGPASEAPERVIDRLREAFARHHLPPVTGFLNGVTSESHPADRAALRRWVDAGNRLGNHTYSHLDLARVDVATYLADIDRNERELSRIAGPPTARHDWRVFRYPFLQEGASESAREAVRAHLRERGYRIAEVTIDFEDWEWFPAFARCADGDARREVDLLRALYRQAARKELLAADKLARDLLGRPIRQILLLHAGEFTAEMIDDLLSEYEALGVRFVSLDDALEDSAYHVDPRIARSYGSPFLYQLEAAQGRKTPETPWPPHAELAVLCR